MPIVEATGLRKQFGETQALCGLDLEIEAGTVLGVLGPNGAGKTTAVRILTTLITPDAGRASIDGIDVSKDPQRVRSRIGLTGQYAAVDERLTARENLELIGRFFRMSGGRARQRSAELLKTFDLEDVADRVVKGFSGGMRRRIDIAMSLIARPKVLFLDEPTTGLDPTARTSLWEVVDELTTAGTTVVLTTQYLDEADRLAAQIVVLDHGRVAARGTPAELKRLVGGKVVTATITTSELDRLPARPDTDRAIDGHHVNISFTAADAATAGRFVADLTEVGVTDLDVTSPSLDDVFAHLTTTGVPS